MRYKVYYRTDDPYANWEAFDVGSARDRDDTVQLIKVHFEPTGRDSEWYASHEY